MARDEGRGMAVPKGRLSRLGVFGRIAGGVAGNVIAEGAKRLADGERPKLSDLVLTPANATRVADQLSHLRGAAMKMGQMISMDAGDVLPAELTAILARLRDRAHHMPPQQLQQVLAKEWGADWRRRFRLFEAGPIAAASIGQVHRATLPDGRVLAIKVQYPGVAESIDADVDNVSTLLRLSGLLPSELDVAPLLVEAKRQLREEADYVREAEQCQRFRELLADDDRFVLPEVVPGLSTARVLAMTFVEGKPIESLETADQATRNDVMTAMIDLVMRELFVLGWMQTDPNFANFRIQPDSGKIILLDFGAARPVAPEAARAYRALLEAGLAGERDAVRSAAIAAGFVGPVAAERHRGALDRMIDVILEELGRTGPFNFGQRDFVAALRDNGMAIAQDRQAWHIPPTELLFVQRKISGTALLGARLKAEVDVRAMVEAQFAVLGPAA